MPSEPCQSCGQLISSDVDGRFPPWCSRCGADFKRTTGGTTEAASRDEPPAVTVHAVTEPQYYHRRWRAFGRYSLPARLDGPATITSTVWARCWKQHTCVECGGVYRYKIEREAGGEGSFAEFARKEAEAKLFRRLAREVDPNPCPNCGLVQPDMVGQGKRRGHALATAAAGLLLSMLVGRSYVGGWLLIDDAAMFAAAIAGGAAVAHLAIALSNPNRDREANRRRAEAAVAAGQVEIVSRGTLTDRLPRTPNVTPRQALALVCVVLAAPAFLTPVFVRTANGWPLHRDFPPGVLSPGDDVTITLPAPAEMKSADGRWRAEATAEVLNAAAIGGPATLPATARYEIWGKLIERSRSNLPPRTVWSCLHIPDDPALGGQTLQLRLTLQVVYTVDKGLQFQKWEDKEWGAKFGVENRTATLTREVTLVLTGADGGRRYRESWAIGAVLGLFGSIAGGGALTGLAAALRRRALPPEIIPLHSASGVA